MLWTTVLQRSCLGPGVIQCQPLIRAVCGPGRLLDLLRRVYCFGVGLMKMDLRQESSRHTDAIAAVTQYVLHALLDKSCLPVCGDDWLADGQVLPSTLTVSI